MSALTDYIQNAQNMLAHFNRELETFLAQSEFGMAITAAQALMIHRISTQTINAGDIMRMGYYCGTNSSYNLSQMIDRGFIRKAPSEQDRRQVFISLTDCGLKTAKLVDDFFEQRNTRLITVMTKADFDRAILYAKWVKEKI